MKISVIVTSNSEVVSNTKNEILSLICSQAYKNGLDVVGKFVLKMEPDIIVRTLKFCREFSDFVVFISDTNFEKCYVCKKIICDEFSTRLINNAYAQKNIEEYLKQVNLPLKKEDQTFMQVPEGARCVKNAMGVFQGFLLESEKNTLFFLPCDYNELYHMFFSSVLPYILQKKQETTCSYIFKTFGIKYNEMTSLLKEEIKNKHNIQILCCEYLLDGEVFIFVPFNAKNYANSVVGSCYTKLLPYIYSDLDASLPEVVGELLRLRNKKVVFAEDFTKGKLANMFFEEASGYLDVFSGGFVATDNKTKTNVLGVSEKVFSKASIDLGEVAYQMALGALEVTQADITVSTYGDINKNQLIFAIGTEEGIHVYTENVFGTLNQKVQTACNFVLFKLLKKIQKDDFNLRETVWGFFFEQKFEKCLFFWWRGVILLK